MSTRTIGGKRYRTATSLAAEHTDGEQEGWRNGNDQHSGRTPKIIARPFVWRDPAKIPSRAWLYGRHYVRAFTTCTVAPGSLGKSSLLLVEAIAISLKQALLGTLPSEQVNVWYWNGEDPQEETERRIAAICQRYDLDGRDLQGRLFTGSGRVDPIKLARVARGDILFDDDLATDLCATIEQSRIGVFILDPFISTHGVPESDNTNVDAVVKKLGHIADLTNSCVEFAHHVRKASAGQTETTAEDARGASSIINAVRSARVLNRMTREQAKDLKIAEPRFYFRVDSGKANLAPPEAAKWFHLVNAELANGDHVAVVEPWKLPSALDGITTLHMRQVREMALADNWRKDQRAAGWIGKAVAEVAALNVNNDVDRKRIGDILKVWFANGVLTTELRPDSERHEREFVVPGHWNEEMETA